jgi:hypothetical protein
MARLYKLKEGKSTLVAQSREGSNYDEMKSEKA